MPTPNNRSMPRKSAENESKAMWKWETKKLQQSYLESSPQEKWCLTTSSTLYLPLSGSLQGCSSSLSSSFLYFFLFLSLKLSYEKLSLKTSTFLSFFSYSQLIFFCPSNPNTNLQLSQIFFPLEPLPFSRSALIPNHHPILWFSISLISCSPSYQPRSPLSPKLPPTLLCVTAYNSLHHLQTVSEYSITRVIGRLHLQPTDVIL